MAAVTLLPSEASYMELALRLREEKLQRAQRLVAEAESVVDEAVASVIARAGVEPDKIMGSPRLLRDVNGKPAQLIWRDAPTPSDKDPLVEAPQQA